MYFFPLRQKYSYMNSWSNSAHYYYIKCNAIIPTSKTYDLHCEVDAVEGAMTLCHWCVCEPCRHEEEKRCPTWLNPRTRAQLARVWASSVAPLRQMRRRRRRTQIVRVSNPFNSKHLTPGEDNSTNLSPCLQSWEVGGSEGRGLSPLPTHKVYWTSQRAALSELNQRCTQF